MSDHPLVSTENLSVHFPLGKNLFGPQLYVKAVEGITLQIPRGSFFGLVGESGSGKTTFGRALLKAVPISNGHVEYHDEDVNYNLETLTKAELKDYRKRAQLIFQDPYASLNPRKRIRDSIMDGLEIHKIGKAKERRDVMVDLLQKVGMQEYHAHRYPHEFSGGQRQRIGIARALALKPEFIVCDEPVSALDVSIQSQVLNLLQDLQEEFNLTYLFVAHNLSVIEHISDRVAVMYLGKIVELAPCDDLFIKPLHYYTQALMSAIPVADPEAKIERIILEGEVPTPINPPSGCRFHPRCTAATEKCKLEVPPLIEYRPEHWSACWHVEL